MSYTQLTAQERFEIYRLRQSGLSGRAIAQSLNRAHSTISRELRRNRTDTGDYLPDTAQKLVVQRRQVAKHRFSSIAPECLAQIKKRLTARHSPEQIAGRLKHEQLPTVSHETIYQLIYRDYQGMGAYARCLRHSHIKRQQRGGSHTKRGIIPHRVGIEQRPAIADLKIQIGHWEADTMIGGNHLGAIATYVDKASKFLIARVSKNRTADAIYQATVRAFEPVPSEFRQTITFDNGKEFTNHLAISNDVGIACYFATPYHSWERGLNEHTNGLLRQFFPKGTNFKIVSQSQVDDVVDLINHRPRKSLGYRTPHEVFFGQSGNGALQI